MKSYKVFKNNHINSSCNSNPIELRDEFFLYRLSKLLGILRSVLTGIF